MNSPYVLTLFLKDESESETRLSKRCPALKAANDEDAIALAPAWVMKHKPSLYEAIEAKLRRGDTLIKRWPIRDANFS